MEDTLRVKKAFEVLKSKNKNNSSQVQSESNRDSYSDSYTSSLHISLLINISTKKIRQAYDFIWEMGCRSIPSCLSHMPHATNATRQECLVSADFFVRVSKNAFVYKHEQFHTWPSLLLTCVSDRCIRDQSHRCNILIWWKVSYKYSKKCFALLKVWQHCHDVIQCCDERRRWSGGGLTM